MISQFFSKEIIKLIKSEEKYFQIERSWLSAQHRMLFQIPKGCPPLGETLPGVGAEISGGDRG